MNHIIIRDAQLEDAARLLEIYAYYVKKTAITFEYEVPSLAEFEERIKKTKARYPYLVIERDGVIEGYAYAGPFVGRAAYDWSCELTVYLDRNARKCGLGRKIYEALESRLKKTGILNLYACIDAMVEPGCKRIVEAYDKYEAKKNLNHNPEARESGSKK